jgi:coenzyme F420-reducing hydrogenase delta subunit
MTTASVRPSAGTTASGGETTKLKLSLFHCFNALYDLSMLDIPGCEITSVKMPCSGVIREVFLLKAFEAGADVVIVLVCPEGSCNYQQGNLRAKKRVERVQKLLNEIGIGNDRLRIHNLSRQDIDTAEKIVRQTLMDLAKTGPAV